MDPYKFQKKLLHKMFKESGEDGKKVFHLKFDFHIQLRLSPDGKNYIMDKLFFADEKDIHLELDNSDTIANAHFKDSRTIEGGILRNALAYFGLAYFDSDQDEFLKNFPPPEKMPPRPETPF